MLYAIDANRYEAWVAKAALIPPEATASAYVARRDDDMREYSVVGSDAVIDITGPLTYKYDMWSYFFGGVSYQGIMAKLAAAAGNPDVSRIILLMDTPGGEVTGVTEVAEMVASMSKPTVAFVDPCCASAGLWIGSQCDRIISISSGEIGSLGVQRMAVSMAESLKAAGIDIEMIRAAISPKKNMGHPYEPKNPDAIAEFQVRVDKWGDRFVADVARGRNVSIETVTSDFGQGGMLDADEAVAVGLIDGVMTLGELLAENKPMHSPMAATKSPKIRIRL